MRRSLRRRGVLVVSGLIASVLLVNDARAQPSFACSKASHPSEHAICADEGLAELDRRMAAEFENAVKTSTDPDAARAAQRQWIARSRDCGSDTFCLNDAYAGRLTELSKGQGSRILAGSEDYVEPAAAYSTPVTVGPEKALPRTSNSTPPKGTAVDTEVTGGTHNGDDGLASLIFGGIALALALLVLALLLLIKYLADYTTNRYRWPLILNWWNALHFAGAVLGMFVASIAGPAAGAVVFGGLWLVVLLINIRKTNLLAGLAMTIIQPLVVALLWVLCGAMKAKTERRRA